MSLLDLRSLEESSGIAYVLLADPLSVQVTEGDVTFTFARETVAILGVSIPWLRKPKRVRPAVHYVLHASSLDFDVTATSSKLRATHVAPKVRRKPVETRGQRFFRLLRRAKPGPDYNEVVAAYRKRLQREDEELLLLINEDIAA